VSDIFIYDSNLQLMNRTRRDGNITQIVADEDYLYFTSFQYNNESVNVILSKLTKDALATVWEVTLPDLWWGSMSINSEGIYHGARRRVHKPDISGDLLFDGWAVTKLDKSGNILWEKSEPGVPPLINDMDLSTVAINSIAAVPGGGCLVAGRKKIFNTPYTSSRQAMIAFVDNGEIVWQDSFKVNTYTTNANGIILDNENYALTILNDDAGSYLTKYKIDGITSVTDSKVMPTHLYLSQNYPNPFNPSTKISFVNPSADHVNLTVYDFLGREVTTLVDEVLPAGQKDIEFQASNLASGIYFYRLTSGTRSEFKKMILLK